MVEVGGCLMFRLLSLLCLLAVGSAVAQELPPIPYRPLSTAAEASGQLARYKAAACNVVRLQVGDARLTAQVPKMVGAYDAVPIRYTLSTKAGTRRTAVSVTAFEDAARAKGKKLYDLNVPGNMDVKVDYLGSVSGDLARDTYIPLTADPNGPISPYPNFRHDPLVRTGDIRAAELVWFKWRLTNTGDTILDPEGLSACFGTPALFKVDAEGKEEWRANAINQYVRFLTYLYPGESVELWTMFYAPKLGLGRFYGVQPGNYRLDFSVDVRLHRVWHWAVNIWGGTPIARLSVPFTCTEKGSAQPVQENFAKTYEGGETMPGYLSAYEEFMSSFNVRPASEKDEVTDGVIYVQVPPWARSINVKLVLDKPTAIDAAAVPVMVSDSAQTIQFNPTNPLTLSGQPIFVAQAMPGMRSGVQLGPDVAGNLRRELQEMKALGVNVIASTAGDWALHEIVDPNHVDPLAGQEKWYYDVLVREEKMKTMGWSVYPPDAASRSYGPISKVLGKEVRPESADLRYEEFGRHIDLGDPLVPEVIAGWTLYQYKRWGDEWYRTADNVVPIDIEDTRGWLRDDYNIRYNLGKIGLQRFRDWVKEKYETIEATNAAWGTSFTSFDEIDPQADQGAEDNNPEARPVYNKPDNPFHDWNKAIADWDIFRTQLRMDNYGKALEIIRKEIPEAKFELRTENSNMLVKGDPDSPSVHLRHVYYSQRRAAMIVDEMKPDLVGYHSDYVLIPYTTQMMTDMTKEMVARGIRPIFLPAFNHMRDMVINDSYGRDHQRNYNFDQPTRMVMIHTLVAAYPWWKTIYENGGAAGIIWSDYLCDAFATETQKREIAYLTQKFRTMKK